MTLAEPPAARRRPLWPWIVAGSAVLALVIGGGVGAVVVLSANAQRQADLAAVEQVVRDFDRAYEEVDCDLFEEVTSDDLRDEQYEPDGYDCDGWEENAQSYFDEDGDYTFRVTIDEVTVTGDRARVETSERWERDGVKGSGTVTYRLERLGGRWVITDYKDQVDESDGSTPPSADDETADAAVRSDLANAKIAFLAYYIEVGSFADVDTANLSAYGYTRGDYTDDIHYFIPDDTLPQFCVDATSTSGTDLVITHDTAVAEGQCSDLGFDQ